VGGALYIAAELVTPPKPALFTAAYVLESAGLSPLLLATLGFLGLVYVHSLSSLLTDSNPSLFFRIFHANSGKNAYSENPRVTRSFRFVGGLAIVALALTVSGGVDASSLNPGEAKQGRTLRQVGVIIFAVVYVLLVFVHVVCWSYVWQLSSRGRQVRYILFNEFCARFNVLLLLSYSEG
jgi:hypothetical protein